MEPLKTDKLTFLIKQKASELGFDLCGIAKSKVLKEHSTVLQEWCRLGMNGEMGYLGRGIEKRIDPAILFPGTKSVIVTGLNYYTSEKQSDNNVPQISRYAYGESYHDIIEAKLTQIISFIKSVEPDAEAKAFVDSAPVLEKAWAREAGIGVPGRHSVLINKSIGSFFFLGIILINKELGYDEKDNGDYCADCRICLKSCPTGAINDNRTIDTRKCLAYLTIESKNPVPPHLTSKMKSRVFGCDICQEVCPWNKIAREHNVAEFRLPGEIKKMSISEWANLSETDFNRLFKNSAIGRTGYERLKRNIASVMKLPAPEIPGK